MAKIQDVDIPYLEFAEAAAPGTPAAGIVRVYAKTDALMYQKDDAGAETALAGGGGGGGMTELDYVPFTSDVAISATSGATANTIVTSSAIAYSGSQTIIIEFMANGQTGSAANLYAVLYDGSTELGIMSIVSSGSGVGRAPVHAFRRLTPSAATHTYSIRGFRDTADGSYRAGAGTAGVFMPGFIRISEV